MTSDGLRTLRPRQSLRRLKTALKPSSSSPSSTSPVRSESASSSLSPLSASPSGSSRFSSGGYSFRNLSAVSLTSWTGPGGSKRAIRRKKSSVELEQEEEQREIDDSLTGLVEPRPYAGPTLGGIEEVLDGRV
ncbi:hypothetical protein KC318_g4843 [Hortaea werneckii]|uniref:Uncharacterized protein n=1 Tax=Hortaea werneckii TaxID=91943 RepID=A0A3M7BPM2_HORWE|nr:hypothetical protein KC334_g2884 [Hortaea werneckii]KAI7021410.1 hypothetical protein KC355_g2353 [Hortaea werneckii]KAI7669151.1 hypothetical protein KC318_g4843 [Hortaea werneckii]RMY26355.1 hypothetical protein D0867_00108 [Hortaea werneckii]RMY41753.1 hypothetical protein D0866_00402 [Hortaea werneckii]